MAAGTNRQKWEQSFADSIGAMSQKPKEEGEESPSMGKYDALEYTSYKDMLSSKIQSSVARDQAMKYASSALSSAGFANQGIAESTRAGIQGNYARAIANADAQYQQNKIDIENQKIADSEDRWQSAMTMLQQARTADDLAYVKSNFYDGMTDDQKRMFDYYYASYKKDLAGTGAADTEWIKANTVNETGFTSYKDMVNADVRTENVDKISDVEDEALLLFDTYTVGRTNGDVVRLQHHGGGSQDGVYLIYYNGKWYKTDKDHYDHAANSAIIEGGEFESGTGTFKER